MEWYEALILGIVQGLTEFLPISSSGHLEIASYILKTNPTENLIFTVVVHIATAISIIYVFRKDITEIIKGLFQFKKEEIDFTLKILISSIPVGVIGVLYEKGYNIKKAVMVDMFPHTPHIENIVLFSK